MALQRPAPLLPGARVAVVAPAGPFEPEPFARGLEVLRSRYDVRFTERIRESFRYLAGHDDARRQELQAALDAPEVSAVFCARGGYGAMRLLSGLRLPAVSKPLVGFSDITALHAAASVAGWRSIHGPVVTQLGKQPAAVVERLWALLEGRAVAALEGARTVTPGLAEGPLLGGNLSLLASLAGTPWLPSLRGAVLLLEDIGERPYRLDRMWTHLHLAGAFEGVAGVVLGDFTSCEEPNAAYSSLEVLSELAAQLGVPCAGGFRIGHGEVNEPVVLGARVRLDATARQLTQLEGAVT